MKYMKVAGTTFYVLWGLLHILGGAVILSTLSSNGLPAGLAMMGTTSEPSIFASITNPVVAGILGFHAWNIIGYGLLATIVALAFRGEKYLTGYWLNLLIVGIADAGLVLFMILPGHMTFADGAPGLILFAVAFVTSTLGIQGTK